MNSHKRTLSATLNTQEEPTLKDPPAKRGKRHSKRSKQGTTKEGSVLEPVFRDCQTELLTWDDIPIIVQVI